MFELHRDGTRVDGASPVDFGRAALGGELQRGVADAIGCGAHRFDFARVEDGAAHEEPILAPGAPFGFGERVARRHQPILRSAASMWLRRSS